MPTPRKGESRQDFVSRCIPIVMDEGTAKDQKQASAICYSLFKQKKTGKAVSEETLKEMQQILRDRLRDTKDAN